MARQIGRLLEGEKRNSKGKTVEEWTMRDSNLGEKEEKRNKSLGRMKNSHSYLVTVGAVGSVAPIW